MLNSGKEIRNWPSVPGTWALTTSTPPRVSAPGSEGRPSAELADVTSGADLFVS